MRGKKLFMYTHQINLRKRDPSLYPLTYTKNLFMTTKLGILIIQIKLQIIKNFSSISKHTNNITTSHTDIYIYPCYNCDKYCIGKIQCYLDKDLQT